MLHAIIRTTLFWLGVVSVIYLISTIVPAHAKPCGHGYIAASKTCHK